MGVAHAEPFAMRYFLIGTVAAALLAGPARAAPAALPALKADRARISVSGLSSGGFMAVQYATAFSSQTTGVGVVAGGPYNCAFVNLGGIATCMSGAPTGRSSFAAASGFAALGSIDPVAGIARQKVYLFSGSKDAVVGQRVVDATRDFYAAAGVPAANIAYVRSFAAGHAFISDDLGGACAANAVPFINECADKAALYDQPAAILRQTVGTLKRKATGLSSAPVAFDQEPFGGMVSGMAKSGFVYIPATCRLGGAKCAVHVVFHGCAQSAESVGDAVYSRVGYNEWADTNRIIVLYPQVDKKPLLGNPQGCWDWWGYSGLDFQTRSGTQVKAVNAMVERLTS